MAPPVAALCVAFALFWAPTAACRLSNDAPLHCRPAGCVRAEVAEGSCPSTRCRLPLLGVQKPCAPSMLTMLGAQENETGSLGWVRKENVSRPL
jgi:hypothetical protein